MQALFVFYRIFLAKARREIYLKREPRHLREQKPGLARRVQAPRTVAFEWFIFLPPIYR